MPNYSSKIRYDNFQNVAVLDVICALYDTKIRGSGPVHQDVYNWQKCGKFNLLAILKPWAKVISLLIMQMKFVMTTLLARVGRGNPVTTLAVRKSLLALGVRG